MRELQSWRERMVEFLPVYREILQDGLECPERAEAPSGDQTSDNIGKYLTNRRLADAQWMDAFRKYLSSAYEPVCPIGNFRYRGEYADCLEAAEDAARVITGVLLAMTGVFLIAPDLAKNFFPWLAE